MLPPLFCIFFLWISVGYATIQKNITVDQSGNGDFKTVQEAIDSVPDGNKDWIKIHVNQGVYREKVMISVPKEYIFLEGDGAKLTKIQWGDHAFSDLNQSNSDVSIPQDTMQSATFSLFASNFKAQGIEFTNTYNLGDDTPIIQAVAALIGGDKASFYDCSFIGNQDTLCDYLGRHYFYNCFIEGAIDFVFGFGQSIYDGCTLNTVSSGVPVGYVTAQGRQQSNDPNGFVFKNCHIGGSAEAYLGRGWGNYSRVLFYQTYMENIIVPKGWIDWRAGYGGNFTTFAESDCIGPGSNTSGRVKWEKELSDDDVKKLTSISTFINSDNWLDQQPNDYGYTSD
ncbi:uncharacterized protein A4U43_C05F1760 [Asparagus officinalis]|uniref:Pectinesterase n=1 Tax=Asparagus officinalis TaxID=4686 RepID=A0A5P1ESC0_ASPOF|nr:uncharacterized protein A4U43_C05F1760 [Asparagus officinalis]